MISTETLTEKANALIAAGGLTNTQLAQLSGIQTSLENSKYVVANIAALPDAALNTGRFAYVTTEEEFYFSDGEQWTNSWDSSYTVLSSVAYAWGRNQFGNLGDNTATYRSSPVTVVGGITNWSSISAGFFHSLGVTDAGIAYAWGWNDRGQLGDGTTTNRSSPVTVVGDITNWSSVSAGSRHSLGVTDAGIAYAWGLNNNGQLGDSTTADKSSPVTVVGDITNWSLIAAGWYHSIGVTDAGVAYAWGRNDYGELGDNTTVDKSSPVTVVGGITNWSLVSAGSYHSLGVTDAGVAYAWGRNNYGQLGDDTTAGRSSPVTVVGDITNCSLVSAGYDYSIGVTDAGIAYAWGRNQFGNLGDNTTVSKSSPITVVGDITNWSLVVAGYSRSLGVTDTGVAYAWGRNDFGQLGDDTTDGRSSPVTVVGGITNWSLVAAGFYHSLALSTDEKGFPT